MELAGYAVEERFIKKRGRGRQTIFVARPQAKETPTHPEAGDDRRRPRAKARRRARRRRRQ
jgi:hypothetical protein